MFPPLWCLLKTCTENTQYSLLFVDALPWDCFNRLRAHLSGSSVGGVGAKQLEDVQVSGDKTHTEQGAQNLDGESQHSPYFRFSAEKHVIHWSEEPKATLAAKNKSYSSIILKPECATKFKQKVVKYTLSVNNK